MGKHYKYTFKKEFGKRKAHFAINLGFDPLARRNTYKHNRRTMEAPHFKFSFVPCGESKNNFGKYKELFVKACSTMEVDDETGWLAEGFTGMQRLGRKIQH